MTEHGSRPENPVIDCRTDDSPSDRSRKEVMPASAGRPTGPAFLALFACLLLPGPSLAQVQPAIDIDSLLRENAYALRIENGGPAGPGGAFLARAVAGTRFVAIGEQHNNRQIPPLATALFALLHRQEGYRFLILEQDPVMMQRVSRAPAKGSPEAVEALAVRYPMGFTFISDQELAMIADIGAIAETKADAVWGCEQAFGVTHILDELRALAPDEAARAILDRERARSAAAEAGRNLGRRHYLFDTPLAAVADELDRLFDGAEPATYGVTGVRY